MGDGVDEDDFRAEKVGNGMGQRKDSTGYCIQRSVCFGPLGAVFGAGNSRLPIQSVIPNIDNIMTAQGEDARSMAMIKELSKPLYGFLLPFGGLQAKKKTVEGAATMFAGGSYSYDKRARKSCSSRPTDRNRQTGHRHCCSARVPAMRPRAWRESGYETLNAEETKAF